MSVTGRPGQLAVLVVCLGLLAGALALAAGQQIRCTCPSVRAEGRGQSDCSACEAGGLCTIDFNAFGREVEEATLQRLQAADVLVTTFKFVDGPAHTAFDQFGADQKALADQILVYLALSAATRQDGSANDLRDLARTVRSDAVQAALMDAFGPTASKLGRTKLPVPRPPAALGPISGRTPVKIVADRARISPGCVEVRVPSGAWFMYKALWADAYGEERCGGAPQ